MAAQEVDTRGAAIVGMALAQAILAALRAKKILTDVEADEILDHVLSGLEVHLPIDDPSVQQARHLVDMIGRISSEQRRAR